MKRNLNRRIRVRAVPAAVILFLSLAPCLSAFGSGDRNAEFRSETETVFQDSAPLVERGKRSPAEAQRLFADLRVRYKVPYTDEAGILDSIIDRLGAGKITLGEAREYFSLLQNRQTVSLRASGDARKTDERYLVLARMLREKIMGAGEPEASAESLRRLAENYYFLFKLDYDARYGQTMDLIDRFGAGAVSREGFIAELTGLKEETESRIRIADSTAQGTNSPSRTTQEHSGGTIGNGSGSSGSAGTGNGQAPKNQGGR